MADFGKGVAGLIDIPRGSEAVGIFAPMASSYYLRVMQFYYHPDHLGSSSYITNLDGEVVQHIEYVPFGEVFVEERNNISNNPLRRQRNGKR